MMKLRRKLQHEDGAAAVEFALIAGVLAMLIFGMLQFGLAFFELQNLRAAAREGARAGAVGATVDQVKTRTKDASLGALGTTNGIEVRYSSTGTFTPPPPLLTTGTATACPPRDQQTVNSSVQVLVNLNNVGTGLQNIFTVDIPLLPQIALHPAISGEFRCEGN